MQVNRLADAVIRSAFDLHAVIEKALERGGEFSASRVKDREMIQASAAWWRLRSVFAGPGVESDMMVIAARGKEHSAVAVALRNRKAEDVTIETDGAFEVRHREVNVTDSHFRMDGLLHHNSL